MSSGFGGNKAKPEDLFSSLKIMKDRQREESSVGIKFFERFASKMTETSNVSLLKGEIVNVEVEGYGRPQTT